ncbi:MAG: PDZ domain-containing protein [bacterium]
MPKSTPHFQRTFHDATYWTVPVFLLIPFLLGFMGTGLNSPAEVDSSTPTAAASPNPGDTGAESENDGWLYIDEGMGYSLGKHVPQGEEEQALRDQGWLSNLIAGPLDIETPNQVLPLRGHWNWKNGEIEQANPGFTQTILLFSPVMANGEIHFQARPDAGQEGVRVVFGYNSPTRYFVWNLGGWDNTCSMVEKWSHLHERILEEITPRVPFQLSHGQWHDIRLVLDSSEKRVEGYVDGAQILECVIPDTFEGRLGIGTWLTHASFKSIRVTGTGSSGPVYPATLTNPKEFFNKLGIRVVWESTGRPGIPIHAVVYNSPAFVAGLQSDDLITAVEGIPLDDPSQYRSLIEKALALASGEGRSTITLTITRSGAPESRTVTLSTIPRITPSKIYPPNGPGGFIGGMGMMGMGGYGFGGPGGPRGPGGIMPGPPITLREDRMIADKQWEDTPWTGSLTLRSEEHYLPLRGGWLQNGETFEQTETAVQPAVLLFSPYMLTGEIRLRVKTSGGAERAQIIFGFASFNQFHSWNIGEWNYKYPSIELWSGLNPFPQGMKNQPVRYSFIHGLWHDIRAVIDSDTSRFEGYVDGRKVITTQLDLPLEGRLGVGTWNTRAEFQSIQIIGPEPEGTVPTETPSANALPAGQAEIESVTGELK